MSTDHGRRWSPATLAVHAGRPAAAPGAPLNEPIGLSSTFHAGTSDNYVRHGSMLHSAFETALGALEGGPCVAFGSGMAASSALVGLLPVGAVVVTTHSLYSGNAALFAALAKSGRLAVQTVDTASPSSVAVIRQARPQLVWIEALSNPLIDVADIAAIAAVTHEVGGMLVVDATFCSPMVVRPLTLGADVVMHSVTKVLGGHSDALMGAVITASPALASEVAGQRTLTGAVPGALETFLALRGLRTLPLRIAAMQASAAELARRLPSHPAVSRVRHPSLPSHPGHALAARWDGFGYVVSFELHGGAAAADAVCDAVELIVHATSLGGVETLIERRARYEIDAARGTPPSLLRLSVGIEDVNDLWADLLAALPS